MHISYTRTSLISRDNRIENRIIRSGWAAWLDKTKWTYFCTFTAKYRLTKKAARFKAEKLISLINQKNGFSNPAFWVAEPFQSGDYHIHMLISIPDNSLIKEDIINTWLQVSGSPENKSSNKCLVDPYIRGMGGHLYVTKFIGRHDIDYDLAF